MKEFLFNPWVITIVSGLVVGLILYFVFGIGKTKKLTSGGGKGGNVKVEGNNSVAVGGIGGGDGPGGKGGDGGGVDAKGDNVFAMGGEGGEAGQADRGGRGGRSPMEILGVPNRKLPNGTHLWDYGKGGDGAGPKNSSKD